MPMVTDYGLGPPLLTMIAVVLTAFIMNFTTVGRKIYAMGGRESASRVGFQRTPPAAVRCLENIWG